MSPTPKRPSPKKKSQSQSPPPEPEAPEVSGPASATGFSAFIGNPGPAFDPENPPEPRAAAEPPEDQLLPVGWDETAVRDVLAGKGRVLHGMFGVGERDWLYTRQDLDSIAPPLTRILNRYPATAAAGHLGDEIALTFGVGGYAVRSYSERREVLRRQAAQPDVPITGRAPAPGDVPPTELFEEEAPEPGRTTPLERAHGPHEGRTYGNP